MPFLVISGVKIDQVRTTALADLGFEERGLFAARIRPAALQDAGPGAASLIAAARARLGEAGGVASVTLADGLPLDFEYRISRVTRDGDPQAVAAQTTRVADDYFATMRIPIVRGRGITTDDRAGAEEVVVISEPLAAQLFADEDPLGRRVSFAVGDDRTPRAFTVVGVTADLVTSQMGNPRPQMFLPLAQQPAPSVMLIARAAAAEPAMETAFAQALAPLDPDFPAAAVISGDDLVRRSMNDLWSHSIVAAIPAAIALALAALGTYGVVGFMVATRTREIGVRMALGASRARVLGSVLRDAIRVALPGVAVGLALGVVLIRTTGGFDAWYPLGAAEPLAYTFGAVTALTVALLAGLPSARRAARVDPLFAMRAE